MPKTAHKDPMADETVLVEEDYKSGKLTHSRLRLPTGDIRIRPVEVEDETQVRMVLPWRVVNFTPEEAYWLGDTLMEHAKSLGFDAEKED